MAKPVKKKAPKKVKSGGKVRKTPRKLSKKEVKEDKAIEWDKAPKKKRARPPKPTSKQKDETIDFTNGSSAPDKKKRGLRSFSPKFKRSDDEDLDQAIVLDDDVELEVRPQGWWVTGTPGRNRVIVVTLIVVLLLGMVSVSYNFIIPRTEVEMRTVYHERPGGGGTGGGINVNFFIDNQGTAEINQVKVTLKVFNETMQLMASTNRTYSSVAMKGYREVALAFIGNHYEDYTIQVSCSFRSFGEAYARTYEYRTVEEQMNLHYIEEVSTLKL